MQRNQRTALLLGAVAIAIAGFVLANSGSSGKRAAQTRHFQVTVVGAEPRGGVQTLTANKGDTVQLDVTSDVADEIHIHGYNIHQAIRSSGGSLHFRFKATIDGVFVIELESRARQIASLKVSP